jgi:acetate kinase
MPDAKRTLIVLALNSGSSSLKFGLYRAGPFGVDTLVAGLVEAIGEASGRFHAEDGRGAALADEAATFGSQKEALVTIARLLSDAPAAAPDAIGHRVVHGGPHLSRHCLIDDRVLETLEAATAFAPLHLPPALSVMGFARDHFPGLPQVACFDTAFHAGLPDVASVLPIARELQSEGVRRYGFHGLSCESIVHQLGDTPPDRLIIAHLGAGASITAVKGGRSVDTSMGLTPTGGVIMGTRSGDLDPGVLVYLARQKGFDAAGLEDLVDRRSGMRGVSGVTGDVRRLRQIAPSSAPARLALEMFCYSVRKQVAAMTAVLEGLDLLVFTGGVGENDPETRATVCAGLGWAGVGLDQARNRGADNPVSGEGARCEVRVLPSKEDEQIARHTAALASAVSCGPE